MVSVQATWRAVTRHPLAHLSQGDINSGELRLPPSYNKHPCPRLGISAGPVRNLDFHSHLAITRKPSLFPTSVGLEKSAKAERLNKIQSLIT